MNFSKYLIFCFCLVVNFSVFSNEINNVYGIKDLYAEALFNDPLIKAAAHNKMMGTAKVEEAFGRFFPQANLNITTQKVNRTDGDINSKIDGNRKSLEINQVIFDGQIIKSYEKSKSYEKQSYFDFDNTKIKRTVFVIESYLNILEKKDEVDLLEKEIILNEMNLEKVKNLFKRQMATITDVLSVSANNDILKVSLIDAENLLSKEKYSISEVLGRDFNDALKIVSDDDVHQISIAWGLDDIIALTLKNNKEYLSKTQSSEVAALALDESLAEHLPKVNFNISMQKNNIGYDYVASKDSDVYAASLQLTIPIYSGGSSYSRNKFYRESLNKNNEELEAVKRSLSKSVTDFFNEFNSEKKRIKAAKQALNSAEMARVAAEKSFSYGVIDVVDLQDRINKEFKAKKEFNLSKYKLIKFYLYINALIGFLDQKEIDYIDSFFLIP